MELALCLDAPGRRPLGVVINAHADTPVGEVAQSVVSSLGLHADGTALFDGSTRLDPAAPLGAAGLVNGATVGVGRPVPRSAGPAASLELAVVSGPAAGTTVPVPAGSAVTVGRGADNTLVVDDALASRHHARIAATPGGGMVTDLGSRNGVGWAGHRIMAPQALTPGDVIQIGDTVVELRVGERPARVLDPSAPDGTRRFNRPPRLASRVAAHEVLLPRQPAKPNGRRFPLLSLLAPVGIGALMVLVTSNMAYAAFVILSPVMMLGNYMSDRRNGRRTYLAELAEFRAAQAELDANLTGMVTADERARRAELPDPAALVRVATEPTARLWERRVDDADFLRLRVGLADAPANVRYRDVGDAETVHPVARLVPTAYDLDQAGVAGMAGPRAAVLAWARTAISQIAVLHGPAGRPADDPHRPGPC